MNASRRQCRGSWSAAAWVLGACGFLFLPSSSPAGSGAGGLGGEAVDVETYFAVRQLRRDLALTDRDLAAMGCDEKQSRAILQWLIAWSRGQRPALDGAARSMRVAAGDLRTLKRRMNGGPRDASLPSQVSRCERAIASLSSARVRLLEDAASGVDPLLSGAQATVWRTARSNLDAPLRDRYAVVVSARSRRVGSSARRRVRSQGAAASFGSRRLSVSRRSDASAARRNIVVYRNRVAAVTADLLPFPKDILPR